MNGDGLIINDVFTQDEFVFVSDFVKLMNLKSINIVTIVFASNAGCVFTFMLMWNAGMGIERGALGLQVVGCIWHFTW